MQLETWNAPASMQCPPPTWMLSMMTRRTQPVPSAAPVAPPDAPPPKLPMVPISWRVENVRYTLLLSTWTHHETTCSVKQCVMRSVSYVRPHQPTILHAVQMPHRILRHSSSGKQAATAVATYTSVHLSAQLLSSCSHLRPVCIAHEEADHLQRRGDAVKLHKRLALARARHADAHDAAKWLAQLSHILLNSIWRQIAHVQHLQVAAKVKVWVVL